MAAPMSKVLRRFGPEAPMGRFLSRVGLREPMVRVLRRFRRPQVQSAVDEALPEWQATSEFPEADAFLPRAQRPHAKHEFRGHFEGLWTDLTNASDHVARRRRAGQIDEEQETLLRHWIEHGFVVLPGAVDEATCDELVADLQGAFARGDERLHVLSPGDHFGRPLQPGTDMTTMRVNDIYAYYESAQRALFNDAVVRFLSIIFDAPPLLLQSLTFEKGSQQGFHQDTAYVVVDPPLALAASWLALEDVTEGSGELRYLDGSHRLPDYLFSGDYKCWHPTRDGAADHDEFLRGLVVRAEAAGLPERRLLARKGDVLIWSADLAHGGSPVQAPAATRRSLVGHFCPDWAVPRYFDTFPQFSGRVACRGGYYASTHYDVTQR